MTDNDTISQRNRCELNRQLIMRLRDSLYDCDIAVDDARQELTDVLERVRLRVKQRDEVAKRLEAAITREESLAA